MLDVESTSCELRNLGSLAETEFPLAINLMLSILIWPKRNLGVDMRACYYWISIQIDIDRRGLNRSLVFQVTNSNRYTPKLSKSCWWSRSSLHYMLSRCVTLSLMWLVDGLIEIKIIYLHINPKQGFCVWILFSYNE